MAKIVVVSYPDDKHATRVMKRAQTLGKEAILWDISEYPKNSDITFTYAGGSGKELLIGINGKRLSASQISGIYWRRPRGQKGPKENSRIDEYIRLESEVAIRSLCDFLPQVNWISHPENARLACRKPVQLKLAKELGARIPATCITNSPEEFRKFLETLGNRALTMKPAGTAFIPLARKTNLASRKNRIIFTQIVRPKLILENIDMVRNCPVIFQEAIIKDFDVRVTVVDKEVFASKIELMGCEDPVNLDWRNYAGARNYTAHKLPGEISDLCVNIVAGLGLRFGCLDFAFAESEGYVFFEVNPQGQWLPSELKVGYDISGSLVRSLSGGVEASHG
ncbi:MAG: MvdC/MvdD family ATP grasp protein [Patescibacteria group bacterium]